MLNLISWLFSSIQPSRSFKQFPTVPACLRVRARVCVTMKQSQLERHTRTPLPHRQLDIFPVNLEPDTHSHTNYFFLIQKTKRTGEKERESYFHFGKNYHHNQMQHEYAADNNSSESVNMSVCVCVCVCIFRAMEMLMVM